MLHAQASITDDALLQVCRVCIPQDSFFLHLPYVSVVMEVLQQGSSHACASITDNYLLQVLTCT